jgi:apolipoprotein N-acyltransferase
MPEHLLKTVMAMKNLISDPRILAITGGILAGFAFPPVPLPFLAVPGFALLLHADAKCRPLPMGWMWPYAGLLVWNLITSYWLMMATVAGGLASLLANAGVMFLALRFSGWFLKTTVLPRGIASFSAASVWTLFEAFHHRWDLAWPWISLGNAWASWPAWVQFYSATGMLGGTFLMAWSAALLMRHYARSHYFSWRPLLPLLPFIASAFLFPLVDEEETQSFTRVAVLQPNHDSYLPNSGFTTAIGPAEALVIQTRQLLEGDSADVVFWPENGIDGLVYRHHTNSILDLLRFTARELKTPVITGASLYAVYDQEPEFLTRQTPAGVNYDIFNSALLIDSTGIASDYRKIHLVPIVERFPFADFLLSPFKELADVRPLVGYGKGRDLFLFSTGSVRFPAFVCYDSVFPHTVRRSVANGAGFIAVITNDGWWGHSSGHKQHFVYARLRAIETRRYVIRSANNGISGVISPLGIDQIKTDYWTKTGFTANIPNLRQQTIFVQYGHIPGYILVFYTFAITVYVFLMSRKKDLR